MLLPHEQQVPPQAEYNHFLLADPWGDTIIRLAGDITYDFDWNVHGSKTQRKENI